MGRQGLSLSDYFFHFGVKFFYKKKKVTYLRLRILPEGIFMLSIPKECSHEKVLEFLDQHKANIIKINQTLLPINTKKIELFGKSFTLILAKKQEINEKLKLFFANLPSKKCESFVQRLPKNKDFFTSKDLSTLKEPFAYFSSLLADLDLNNFYDLCKKNELYFDKNTLYFANITKLEAFTKALLSLLINDYLAYTQSLLGVKCNGFVLASFRAKWGSCSPVAKQLKFASGLVHLPPSLIKYVVLHECAHLLEANHSYKFYKIMANFMPEYKKKQELLQIQGKALVFFSIIKKNLKGV